MSFAARNDGEIQLRGENDESWHAIFLPPALPPGAFELLDARYKGSPALRKRKIPHTFLPTGGYLQQFAVLQEQASVFAGIADFVVRPAPLVDDKGKVADYVIVEVVSRYPLDRKASKATWSKGWLKTLEQAAWSTPPPARAFRLLDRPALLFVDRALAEVLRPLAGNQLAFGSVETASGMEIFPPEWSYDALPPLKSDDKAEAAFWLAASGSKDKDARAQALTHPWWAYALACAVDRAAKADTRAAACRHPIVAMMYARDVDRKGHADTRAAASAHGLAAVQYALEVDHELDPRLPKARLTEAGHDAESYAQLMQGSKLMGAADTEPITDSKVERYAPEEKAKKGAKRHHTPLPPELISDIDAFILHGYRLLGFSERQDAAKVVTAMQKMIETKPKLNKQQRMQLGCAWGEQLHRALGWQWAQVHFDGGQGIALVSPDRALAHFPFEFASSGRTTFELLFNMLRAGNVPQAKPYAYETIS